MISAELIEKLKELPLALQSQIEKTVDKLLEDRSNNLSADNKSGRGYGSMKGLIKFMADDFDEPLEDFKDYM